MHIIISVEYFTSHLPEFGNSAIVLPRVPTFSKNGSLKAYQPHKSQLLLILRKSIPKHLAIWPVLPYYWKYISYILRVKYSTYLYSCIKWTLNLIKLVDKPNGVKCLQYTQQATQHTTHITPHNMPRHTQHATQHTPHNTPRHTTHNTQHATQHRARHTTHATQQTARHTTHNTQHATQHTARHTTHATRHTARHTTRHTTRPLHATPHITQHATYLWLH